MDVASVTQAIVTAVVATAVPTATATDPASAAPLSRPKSHHEKHIASIVILITAALSVTGALWMIMGFLVSFFSCWLDKHAHNHDPFTN